MTKDNSTGKDKEFYELGKKMFDRLKPFMPSAPAAGHQCEPQPVQPVNDKLLQIIAATYQIAGVYDAPEHVLDVLANPELATQEQIDALLPFVQPVQPDWLLSSTQDLAKHIARRCYPEVPQFEVLSYLAGVISQIDNMITGMERKAQPVQRPWVGLTEDEATDLWENTHNNDSWELIKRVEAKLKEKNI